MAIGGKQKEFRSFDNSLEVGFFEAEVVSINPDKEELVKLLNVGEDKIDDFKDPEYLTESKDGFPVLRVSVWMRALKNQKLYNKAFFLEKKERVYKESEDSEVRYQYINDAGRTQWALNKEELSDSFRSKPFRVAYSGEDKLYDFLRNWLRGIDFKTDPDACILMDSKKLFNGNVKELRDQVGGIYSYEVNPQTKKKSNFSVIGMAEVRTKDDKGETKSYQHVYDKFLPGYVMKHIRNTRFTEENIEIWREKKGQKAADGKVIYLKDWENLATAITDSKNGSKNFYFLGELKEYNAGENPVAPKEEINEEDESY